jgi:DNA-binding response OmpR family regulator
MEKNRLTVGRVLVVDTDPVCRAVIAAVLDDGGFAVLTYDTVDDLVEVIDRTAPDAVVLDLPGADREGLRLLDQLRDDPGSRAVPLIVCSTNARLLDEQRAFLQRCRCQMVVKPFDINDLLGAVRAVVMRTADGCERTSLPVVAD